MIFRQRLSFRLTPLLDLLLIVIFAQYLEVEQTATEARESVIRDAGFDIEEFRRTDWQSVLRDADEARAQVAELERQLDELRQLDDEERRAQAMRELELRAALDRALAQQAEIGELVGELFRAPAGVVEEALVARNLPGRTAEEIERLRRMYRDLGRQRGREVFEHLVAFEELSKRSEIWKLTVGDGNAISLAIGGDTHVFRARTSEEFADRFFRQYKMLPQPKSLVLVLVIYRDGATAETLFAVQRGLAGALDRMRQDSNQRTRFEYAELGYVDPRDSEANETP
ncbi:MAG: hypothetical protein WD066_03895 [Planctomycetaceae bacterium]